MMVVSLEQDIMNLPLDATAMLMISVLCLTGKSNSPVMEFPVPSFFLLTLKTRMVLPFAKAVIKALWTIAMSKCFNNRAENAETDQLPILHTTLPIAADNRKGEDCSWSLLVIKELLIKAQVSGGEGGRGGGLGLCNSVNPTKSFTFVLSVALPADKSYQLEDFSKIHLFHAILYCNL